MSVMENSMLLWPDTAMTWPEAVFAELILAGIAWNILKLATRNIRRFFELRYEVRQQMLGVAAALWPSDKAAALQRGDPEPATFRELGFQILMLAHSARLANWTLKRMGFDPIKAGDNLISLAHDPSLAFRRKAIARALRFALLATP
jgi:hypothetical protein